MSKITLESGLARATIMPERGALVTELTLADRSGKQQNIFWLPETFTSLDCDVWPGGGLPFLFPFAGRVWHDSQVLKYEVAGNVYSMPLHGFAWASSWVGVLKSSNTALLSLKSDESTKKLYPFDFEIGMTVTLSQHTLHVAIEVTHKTLAARTREKMPVALGWHPYFSMAKALKVQIPADTIYPVTPDGNAADAQRARDLLGIMPWDLPNPKLASLIIGDLAADSSRMDFSTHALTISAGPEDVMQHVVTWTNRPLEFLCIEPWMSLPDAVARPRGCRWLKPGENLAAWFNIECR